MLNRCALLCTSGLSAELGSTTSDPKAFADQTASPTCESPHGCPQATLSINGLWGVLSKLGVKLTPIEREEVKARSTRRASPSSTLVTLKFARSSSSWIVEISWICPPSSKWCRGWPQQSRAAQICPSGDLGRKCEGCLFLVSLSGCPF